MSADPFVQDPFSSQSLNRFSYVFNNPLTFTDPSGFEAERLAWLGGIRDRIADAWVRISRKPVGRFA
jgi:hypothetical protein